MSNLLNFIHEFDYSVSAFVLAFRNPFWDAFNILISYLGHFLLLFGVLIIFLLYTAKHGRFIYARLALSAYFVTGLVSLLLKIIFNRERPSSDLALYIEHLPSFPSAHSALALAVWGAIIFYIYRDSLALKFRNLTIAFLFLIIVLVGFSRLYLGVHFLSDILAGYFLAALVLYFTIRKLNSSK